MEKASDIFEGENSSLKQAFDQSVNFDLPTVKAPKAKPRIHNFADSVCESCEG